MYEVMLEGYLLGRVLVFFCLFLGVLVLLGEGV